MYNSAILVHHRQLLYFSDLRNKAQHYLRFIALFAIGLIWLITSNSPSIPMQHQLDNDALSPSVTINMLAAPLPSMIEEQVNEESEVYAQSSPTEALIAARSKKVAVKKIVKTQKKPLKKVIAKPADTESLIKSNQEDVGKDAVSSQGGQSQANTNANNNGDSTKIEKEQYLNLLRQKIEENKVYPRNAKNRGESGVTHVKFHLDPQGNLYGPQILRSSGYILLDNAVIDAINKTKSVGYLPKGMAPQVTFALRFQLKKGF